MPPVQNAYYASRTVTGADEMKRNYVNEWDEYAEMEWNLWYGKTGETPEENLLRLRFVRHETHMEWHELEAPSAVVTGERLTVYATGAPIYKIYIKKRIKNVSWRSGTKLYEVTQLHVFI